MDKIKFSEIVIGDSGVCQDLSYGCKVAVNGVDISGVKRVTVVLCDDGFAEVALTFKGKVSMDKIKAAGVIVLDGDTK